jgi:hypothetical protein
MAELSINLSLMKRALALKLSRVVDKIVSMAIFAYAMLL